MDGLTIRADAVTIRGTPDGFSDVTGLWVAPGGWNGWEDGGGEVRRESVPRPSSHGEFDLPVFQGSMVFSVDGHALARSPLELGHLRRQVTGLGASGSKFRVSVDLHGETLWVMARRGAKPTFKDSGIRSGLLRARFLLQFVASDPRKHGEKHEFPGGWPAINRGNFPADPVLIVTGVMPAGYSVHGPDGRVLTVSQPLAAGQSHRIDLRTGRVYRDGVLQVGVRRGPVWSIPAASAVVHTLVPVSGSGSLIVRVTDTYI